MPRKLITAHREAFTPPEQFSPVEQTLIRIALERLMPTWDHDTQEPLRTIAREILAKIPEPPPRPDWMPKEPQPCPPC